MAAVRYVYIQNDATEKTRIEANLGITFGAAVTNNPTEIMFTRDPVLTAYEKEQLDDEMAGRGFTFSGNVPDLQMRLLTIAITEENTILTSGTAKVTFRMPCKSHIENIRSSAKDASSSGLVTLDLNEEGVSILSTKLTMDVSEKTSKTAATPLVISDGEIADDAEMTIDADGAGTGVKGLKMLISYFPVP